MSPTTIEMNKAKQIGMTSGGYTVYRCTDGTVWRVMPDCEWCRHYGPILREPTMKGFKAEF